MYNRTRCYNLATILDYWPARESRRSLNIALDFYIYGGVFDKLTKDFLYLPGSSVCDDPGKYKKIWLQTVL